MILTVCSQGQLLSSRRNPLVEGQVPIEALDQVRRAKKSLMVADRSAGFRRVGFRRVGFRRVGFRRVGSTQWLRACFLPWNRTSPLDLSLHESAQLVHLVMGLH